MAIALFEEHCQRERFYPLTFTKPFAELHCGIFTFHEWWGKFTKQKVTDNKFDDSIAINSHILPNENIWNEIQNLAPNVLLKDSNGNILAAKNHVLQEEKIDSVIAKSSFDFIETPHQLLQHHSKIIEQQFHLIKKKKFRKISHRPTTLSMKKIFL